MKGGTPARLPISVQPVWTATYVPYGDPAKPIASVAVPSSLALPAGATSFELRAFVTGHGQGNLENCAEFVACLRERRSISWPIHSPPSLPPSRPKLPG